jgi:type II secretory pathway component PulM
MKFQTIIRQLWDSRSPRERLLIMMATAVIGLGSVYAGVLDPALTGLTQLKTSLPAAQAELTAVKALALQLQAMPKADTVSDSAMTQTSLQTALNSAGIDGTVSALAPWHISIRTSNGDALWAWLRQHPVSQTELKRTDSDTAANWQGELTLAP